MQFDMKNTLKNNHNHTPKHTRNRTDIDNKNKNNTSKCIYYVLKIYKLTSKLSKFYFYFFN